MNRSQRRKLSHNAGPVAAKLAGRCYDFHGRALVPIADSRAVAALTRAFALLLRSRGRPVAVPISDAEAEGFPRWQADRVPGGVTWLAVGLDAEQRASYALQSAASPDRATAHDAARSLALSRLADVCATAGFPMGAAKGHA